jgi:alkylation response protein AidB-like acyl-CoA dehydrogenase
MDLKFTPRQQEVYDLADRLSRQAFEPRAASYDAQGVLPLDDLRDLASHGLLHLAIGADVGGGDSGILGKQPLLYLLALERAARASLATSHSLQVHSHAVHFIDQRATPEQRKQLLRPIIARNAMMTTLSSEPGRTAQGDMKKTTADRVDGGYIVNGIKNYATLAGGSGFLLVLADAGTGAQTPGSRLALVIPTDAPGVRIELSSWDPYGMRAAVSPVVEITDHFVPASHVIGAPGLHLTENWAVKADLGFASQYAGASRGILDALCKVAARRGLGDNPYLMQHVGEAFAAIEAARLSIYAAAEVWRTGTEAAAEAASIATKLQALHATRLVLDCTERYAGPSAFASTSPLTRMTRDLRFLLMREHPDAVASSLGRLAFEKAVAPQALGIAA